MGHRDADRARWFGEVVMAVFDFLCLALIVTVLVVAFDLLVERRGEK
jgi:hypothetical protein